MSLAGMKDARASFIPARDIVGTASAGVARHAFDQQPTTIFSASAEDGRPITLSAMLGGRPGR
eukprot:73692-Prymnesium_polylepis.1